MYVDETVLKEEFEKSKQELFSYLTYLTNAVLLSNLYSPALVSVLLLDKVKVSDKAEENYQIHRNEIMNYISLSSGQKMLKSHMREANKYIDKRLKGSKDEEKILLEIVKIMTYELFSAGLYDDAIMVIEDTQKIYPSEMFVTEIVANLRKNDKIDEMLLQSIFFKLAISLDLKDTDHLQIGGLHIMSEESYQRLLNNNSKDKSDNIVEVKLNPELMN